jgi:2-oxoglutarate ferredoxin oxidoreductase subunit alpha
VLRPITRGRTSGSSGSGTVWPFPDFALAEFRNAKAFLFPEMNLGQMARELERHVRVPVISIPKLGGDLHVPGDLYRALEAA